jgi:hypothetical protein
MRVLEELIIYNMMSRLMTMDVAYLIRVIQDLAGIITMQGGEGYWNVGKWEIEIL